MTAQRRSLLLITIVLLFAAFFWLFPFAWSVIASLKSDSEFYVNIWRLPERAEWQNYTNAFSGLDYPLTIGNTLYVAAASALLQCVTGALAAFAFARMRFPGRDLLFTLFLATLMIPGTVTLTSSFLILARFNWIDTYAALIVPHAASGFAIFLLRQFFMTIPTELEEAAYLDGAGRLRFLWTVVLPLSKPALTTVFVFIFISTYNAFLWPLVVTSSERLRVIQIALSIFSDSIDGGSTAGGQLLAASVLTMLPTIILFMIFQNAFIRGITRTGLK